VAETVERLSARGIDKTFVATKALIGAELVIRPGEVHALIGENGAGKSTLTKVISGVVVPDAGKLLLDGKEYSPRSPKEARAAGVAIVYQEPPICRHMSVGENVLLGAEPGSFAIVDRKALKERAEKALGMVRSPDSLVLKSDVQASLLSPADCQLVSVARALAQTECRLLILDEPTASLAQADVERLFEVIRRLKESGMSVLYISHFLDEVLRISDRYTVIRDGKTVDSGDVSAVDIDGIVERMTGKKIDRSERRAAREPGDVRLVVKELAGKKLPAKASLELRAGEVVGIAGLVGSGRSELLRAIFGLDRVKSGEVKVGAYVGSASPNARLMQGLGLLSEDRKHEGLAEDLTLADNITLSKLPAIVKPKALAEITKQYIQRLSIRAAGPDQKARALSGGNQQKLAIARLLHHDVDVLMLDEPTRGIDIGSRLDVYKVIDELAGKGKAVLVVSSQFPELLQICDRIHVMHRGVLSASRPTSELDEHGLVRAAAAGVAS
jgi:ribose transport system ATP-binding protein